METEQKSKSIVQTEGWCGGRARIDGTRISVATVVESYRVFLEELFVQDFVRGHPHVTERQVRAALEYYRDHTGEIDQQLAADREIYRANDQLPD
ncbi:MAG: DUF433 domain-containing protein [Chloroflexi bacterium]|nr:DUF433 domain-containing protein [Chloroflexota bacterium]